MVVDAFHLNKQGHTHGWSLPVWCSRWWLHIIAELSHSHFMLFYFFDVIVCRF